MQGDKQGIGDLLVRITLGDQLQHIALTLGQQGVGHYIHAMAGPCPAHQCRMALGEVTLHARQVQLPGRGQCLAQHLPGLLHTTAGMQAFSQAQADLTRQWPAPFVLRPLVHGAQAFDRLLLPAIGQLRLQQQ
ncbi:hypothetical protein D3C85_1126850 [compost metagenome]